MRRSKSKGKSTIKSNSKSMGKRKSKSKNRSKGNGSNHNNMSTIGSTRTTILSQSALCAVRSQWRRSRRPMLANSSWLYIETPTSASAR